MGTAKTGGNLTMWQWLMFSKHLQELNFEQLGEAVAELGFDGVDLTVRPNGHIEPDQATQKLPHAVATLQRFRLSVPMITTHFTDPNEPFVKEVFTVAADCGVQFIKLGYWRYSTFGTLRALMDEVRRSLDGFAQLAERYGICVAVHTHSGAYLTASPFVLAELLRPFDAQRVAAYADSGHLAVEGGLMGWQQGLEWLGEKVRVVGCKDFAWVNEQGSWRVKVVPVGDGIVQWRAFFRCLHQMGFDGLISVHSEYAGWNAQQVIAQTRDDLQRLKAWAMEGQNTSDR